MRVKFNEFLAIVYASLFDFPLNREEQEFWAVGKKIELISDQILTGKGRDCRDARKKTSDEKFSKAKKTVRTISLMPTVEAVFLTGSVAVSNALAGADIDLLIVTTANTLWVTRAVVVALLKLMGKYRTRKQINDRVCTNIFLDINHLEFGKRNLYTAHEVLQARCLFDRGNIEKEWLKKNEWAKRYLPKAYQGKFVVAKGQKDYTRNFLRELMSISLVPFELCAFALQYFYMKPKMTREEAAWGKAVFHPNDLTEKVFQKWQKKLRALGYNSGQSRAFFFQS